MNTRRITTFAFVLTIVLLIVGLSACDQIQQLLLPATPQMEGLSEEISIGVVLSITGRFSSAFGVPMGLVLNWLSKKLTTHNSDGEASSLS